VEKVTFRLRGIVAGGSWLTIIWLGLGRIQFHLECKSLHLDFLTELHVGWITSCNWKTFKSKSPFQFGLSLFFV